MSSFQGSALMFSVIATAGFWSNETVMDATVTYDRGEPVGVFVWATVASEVPESGSVRVHVVIKNRRPSEPFRLEEIDISDRYLDGFETGTIEPPPSAIDDSAGGLMLKYHLDVEAERSQEIVIQLRASKPGMYSGDLDVWGNDSDGDVTRRLQTEIVPPPQR